MFNLVKYVYKVHIDLENGVYYFLPDSATGKTYLAKLFTEYMSYGERVRSYTYSDFVGGLSISTVLDPQKYDVVLLDRYDMYYGVGREEIKRYSSDMIILIDCKRKITFCDAEMCLLLLTKEEIKVLQ